MLTRQVNELTLEKFNGYEPFAQVIDPTIPKIGAKPIDFFREMLRVDLGCSTKASFSIVRVKKRPQIIEGMEYHNTISEVNLPQDNDILLYVAGAHAPNEFLAEDVRVFHVPCGRLWHSSRGLASGRICRGCRIC